MPDEAQTRVHGEEHSSHAPTKKSSFTHTYVNPVIVRDHPLSQCECLQSPGFGLVLCGASGTKGIGGKDGCRRDTPYLCVNERDHKVLQISGNTVIECNESYD